MNDFAARVSTLDVENPSKLRTVGQQEEFSPLIEAVNSLGHRVRNLLERERVFLGTCAHEIRTPLAGLLGQLQLIDDDRQLDTARSCAERTARVADQFLTFAASKSLQSARLAEETFDVCEVVRDAIAPLAGNTNALVEMEGLDAQNVRAHSFAISAIASNLVQNALKYGKKDLNALYIRINVSILNNAISLSVEDNGNGLTDEEMKSAMQEFTRVGASASETGAGLGLSIVQEIAIQYGGSVELSRSADLKGLKIAVNLPILTDTVLPQSRPIVEQQYRSSEALLRSAEVLPMPN
ncbi:MAG: HAMP domain-containing sensor histidine kinase [Sulfitobacter sp.]